MRREIDEVLKRQAWRHGMTRIHVASGNAQLGQTEVLEEMVKSTESFPRSSAAIPSQFSSLQLGWHSARGDGPSSS